MWVVLSVNYSYKGKFSQADTWESFSQKWLSQAQRLPELEETSENFVVQPPCLQIPSRRICSKPSSSGLLLWESMGCGQETQGRLGPLQARPTMKHMGVRTEPREWGPGPFVSPSRWAAMLQEPPSLCARCSLSPLATGREKSSEPATRVYAIGNQEARGALWGPEGGHQGLNETRV